MQRVRHTTIELEQRARELRREATSAEQVRVRVVADRGQGRPRRGLGQLV